MKLAQILQGEAIPGFNVDINGRITYTPEAIVAGSSTTIKAITNNGLEKTIRIKFLN